MIEITAQYLASQGLSNTFPQRFWTKVAKNGECWEWIGGTNEHGYGIIGKGPASSGFIKAHRASWILHNGPIPDGMDVLHHCDNPPCVRPDHLFLGNAKINGQDASNKGRMPRGQNSKLAKLTDAQVLEIRSLYRRHAKNQASLAAKFGISVFNLRAICYGRSWKHLIEKKGEESLNPKLEP